MIFFECIFGHDFCDLTIYGSSELEQRGGNIQKFCFGVVGVSDEGG